ncbi:MAG: hypothetical protein K9H64_13545 [Bacteroidales bacterium]|nr:hypothetical protein [Bacteroidales bacterium]MCF8456377.1 hypothetical protein [Bacteroidales bacterium]
MKKQILTLSAILLILTLPSQGQVGKYLDLLTYKGVELSVFGGPSVEISAVNAEPAFANGGGGALLIDQKYFIGGYGTGMDNRLNSWDNKLNNDVDMHFGHGGLWLGYINKHQDMVHFDGSVKMGMGNISIFQSKHHDDKSNDLVLVLTPQAECEINVTTWFKMNLSLGYRLVSGVNDNSYIYPDIDNFSGFAGNDFNSPVVGMSFLFGFFR